MYLSHQKIYPPNSQAINQLLDLLRRTTSDQPWATDDLSILRDLKMSVVREVVSILTSVGKEYKRTKIFVTPTSNNSSICFTLNKGKKKTTSWSPDPSVRYFGVRQFLPLTAPSASHSFQSVPRALRRLPRVVGNPGPNGRTF